MSYENAGYDGCIAQVDEHLADGEVEEAKVAALMAVADRLDRLCEVLSRGGRR